ncbi:MAG TPA: ferritin-like domain-containing protein [Ohtaekwangia sp.]
MSKVAAKKTAQRSVSEAEPQEESALLEFFTDELKDIYWAEKHLVKSLPKMQKAATSEDLKNAIGNHLEETKEHVARLEKIFSLLGEKAQGKKCDGMAGLVEEGNGVIEDTEKGTATRDVGIILSAQKVEHYEISTYGGLCQLAKTLGLDDIKDILGETLEEEKTADELLSQIAEGGVNSEASSE